MTDATTNQRPAWFKPEQFPFESRFAEIDDARIHYVDEGSGPPLLMLHGNPTWSFLYRHLITRLRADFRCIALDYPGFGLSSADADYRFTPAEHAAVVAAFVEHLDLRDYTLLVQDWGGPVGLSAATHAPERVKAMVIGNTWAWPMSDPPTVLFSLLLGHLPGHVLTRRLGMFTNVLLPRARGHSRLTEDEMAMYRGPHPTPVARVPVQTFARQLLEGRGFLADLERRLPGLLDKPALLLWPTADPAFRSNVRRRWQELLTNSETVLLEGAGHFFPDDVPDEAAGAITQWAAGVSL